MCRAAGISDETIAIVKEACSSRKILRAVDLGTGAGYSLRTLLEAAPEATIWTVENEQSFADQVAKTLSGSSLARATFVNSPLIDVPTRPGARHWYKPEPLAVIPDAIDILIVDGPQGMHGRYPALPFFLSRMSRPSMVFLDDCNRPEERQILSDWDLLLTEQKIPHRTEFIKTDRGLGRIDIEAPVV